MCMPAAISWHIALVDQHESLRWGSLVHCDLLVHSRSDESFCPVEVQFEANQVVLASLAKKHIGFDYQLSVSEPGICFSKFVEVCARVNVHDVQRKVNAIESLHMLLQKPLGVVLPDLLASHTSVKLSSQWIASRSGLRPDEEMPSLLVHAFDNDSCSQDPDTGIEQVVTFRKGKRTGGSG